MFANRMCSIIVTAVLLGLTLQGCDAAPWLDGNFSGLVAPCQRDDDCELDGWEPPYPQCIQWGCRCGNSTPCRQRTITEEWNAYAYFCGQCGQMGSACTSTAECPQPFANCDVDGYCKCLKGGNIFHGICRVDKVMTSASADNIVLCFVLLLLLVLNKVVASRRVRNLLRRAVARCSNRGGNGADQPHIGEDGVFHNPRSGEKTASYTISNSDFITSSDDPDLEWALELSRQLQESSRQPGNNSRTTSIRSRISNATRSSSRSRASNASRRSVLGTETRRSGGRNLARTVTSAANTETIDDANQTISETVLDTTSRENVPGPIVQEAKPISTLRNIDETNQTSFVKNETIPLNTIRNNSHKLGNAVITETTSDELKDQSMTSSVPLPTGASTSGDRGAQLDSLSNDKISSLTPDSGSNQQPDVVADCDDQTQNTSRLNKVAGKGKMIILVPKRTY